MKIEKDSVLVNAVRYPLSVEFGINKNAIDSSLKTSGNETKIESNNDKAASNGEKTEVTAPMPGLVLRLEVKSGQTVKKNQVVMVMEAMKMENEIFAPCDGTITSVNVTQGQQLNAGDLLLTIA